MASEEKEDEKLPLISYRKLKTNDREELDRLRFALVDGEHGFFQLDVDDEVDEFDQVAATEKRATFGKDIKRVYEICLLYTSPSPRDATLSRMPSSA